MKPIIRVENLSKQYKIGAQQKPYSTLRESLTDAVRAPFKGFRNNGNSEKTTFWALKDVSFEVNPGEVVGIIGRNGAGKSTLLKILSRITEPTTGKVELYGRVSSLLEVGTGFHHELTGRENIFLNGAILGMKREEIAKKFDEIVDFAEVEDFLDTPVKHYSSGMYMRLAFAVAANLEPEVLIVDEVLAVGDAEFQKKCLGKMKSVSDKEGRTVLFVSHSMPAITKLCNRCILLNKGNTIFDGNVREAVSLYNNEGLSYSINYDG
ncbi:MAG: ABC transporter ATP-binding protein, partial [Pyrinomonadaceae bacterium]